MDEVDAANEHVERERAALLARRKPAGPVACGACHFCGAEVHGEARWCDVECRDAWEKRGW